jgi:probable rRNA maturation factor
VAGSVVAVEVHVQYAVPRRDVPAPASFRRWASAALAGRRAEAQLSVRVVGETEGAELNLRYRGKPGPTNVLSFPFDAAPGVDLPWLGDLVVCAPVVAREALAQGKAARDHWAHLVVHGILHLVGYDHGTEAEAAAMERVEVEVLGGLGIDDPYADRDST